MWHVIKYYPNEDSEGTKLASGITRAKAEESAVWEFNVILKELNSGELPIATFSDLLEYMDGQNVHIILVEF